MPNEEAAAKLRVFAFILKLGHDLFNARNFDEAAVRAVNDIKAPVNFRSAALFEFADGKASLIAQSGIPEKNSRSLLALEQKKLLEKRRDDSALSLLKNSELPEVLAANEAVYLRCRLPRPAALPENSVEYILLLEYHRSVPEGMENLVLLLSNTLSEALYFHRLSPRKAVSLRHRGRKIFYLLLLLAVIGMMFIPVPESVTAEFTLHPEKQHTIYAAFDGTIAEVCRQDGEFIRAGEVIVKYDTAILKYKLAEAESALQELEAEIALEEHNSFTDDEKLGKVRLLEARRQGLIVAVSEARWFLENSVITAPESGVLVLPGGRADLLTGKALHTGEKIFDIFSGASMAAEIPVDEKDASILQRDFSATLFLHTAPEKGIHAEVKNVAAYPELTEKQTYCYKVEATLPENAGNLRHGMRGIAKLSGGNVPLGYQLFKSLLLYFRGL